VPFGHRRERRVERLGVAAPLALSVTTARSSCAPSPLACVFSTPSVDRYRPHNGDSRDEPETALSLQV
jgi:hypothetical protein